VRLGEVLGLPGLLNLLRVLACCVERLVWHSGETGNGTGGTGYGISDAGEYFAYLWGGEMFVWCSGGWEWCCVCGWSLSGAECVAEAGQPGQSDLGVVLVLVVDYFTP
jgi:hypothetical protein